MDVFLQNTNYLLFNTFLALIAVWFGLLMLKPFPNYVRFLCGFIWLIFLPNTIYLLTDLTHLPEDWPKVDGIFKIILMLQFSFFAIVGIITFILAVYFFQILLEGKSSSRRKNIKLTSLILISILNFLVGFGIILGGIQRIHSWYIFSDPLKVIDDLVTVINSKELLTLSFGFGILANIIYFLFIEKAREWNKKFFRK